MSMEEFLGIPKELADKTFHLKVPTSTSLIKKKTNNDIVNEMSAEEKAYLIINKCKYCVYNSCCEYGLTHHSQEMCQTGIATYLKLEAKDNAIYQIGGE